MPETDPIRAVPFPRGIADAQGRHACVRDREGRLVALALERGTVLWRSQEQLRPLVIALDEVIALRPGPPATSVALALAGAAAGRERWASKPLPLPAWAEPGSADPARFWIAATVEGSTILLRWHARAQYEGGAAPSQRVLDQAARDADGSLAVERPSGNVTNLPAPAGGDAPTEPEPGPLAADVLEQRTVGARRYELAVEASAQSARTLLRARDPASGSLLWETTLDEGPHRPPKVLRL